MVDKKGFKQCHYWIMYYKKDANYARCSLCSFDLKCSTQGFQTFTQHAVVKQHKDVSKINFERIKHKSHFLQLPCQRLSLDHHYI